MSAETACHWQVTVNGGQQITVHPGENVEIGRKPLRPLPDDGTKRMEVPDPTKSMSKRHARFSVRGDGQAILHDLDSTNGTYVVRDGGDLMRLPGDDDYILPYSPMRIQFGDVAADFERVDAPEQEPDSPVSNLFDYSTPMATHQEPDATDMSVDQILDLRAGEPTTTFQSQRPKAQRKPVLNGSEAAASTPEQPQYPSPYPVQPDQQWSTQPVDVNAVEPQQSAEPKPIVRMPAQSQPVEAPQQAKPAESSESVDSVESAKQPEPSEPSELSDAQLEAQYEAQLDSPYGQHRAQEYDQRYDLQDAQPAEPQQPAYHEEKPEEPTESAEPVQPLFPEAGTPERDRPVPNLFEGVGINQPEPQQRGGNTAPAWGAGLPDHGGNGNGNANATAAGAPYASAAQSEPTYGRDGRPEPEPETAMFREARPVVFTPMSDGGDRRDATGFAGNMGQMDANGGFTPAFEPGSVFDKVARGEFDKAAEPVVEVDGLSSEEARRTPDMTKQFEMARHAELLPFLAMNPSLYDDLYAWLAAQGDKDIDEALANNPGYQDYRKAVGK
ncbi:FHA domain-containing protein [Bifidobacterium sp. 64T4]|nr:FHA domain-containing protein [Bifidobacterium pongonis]